MSVNKILMKKIVCGLFAIMCLLATSCSTPKDITYMQGYENGAAQAVAEQKRIVVKPDDKLSIFVSCREPELAVVFNLFEARANMSQIAGRKGATSLSSGSSNYSAYTVDKDGNIQFPVIGAINIGGLQRAEVAEKIKNILVESNMLKDPTVTVEFLNTSVYVLGDVSSPGAYAISNESLNIVQALSMAGDLQITGQRQNVLVVREEDGKNRAYRVDLTNTADLMTSPVYYLQQNDIVYVEPNNMKKRNAINNANTLLTPSFWMSVASFLMTLGVLIFD